MTSWSAGQRWPLPRPLLLVALGAGGAWWYLGRVVAPPAAEMTQPLEPLSANKASLAVLPFTNMSGDTKQERLADGLTEDLITELAATVGSS